MSASAQPSITLCPCKSSQIAAHGFDPATGTLALKFNGRGAVYHYANVTPAIYKELCEAESIGSFFHQRIKSAKKEGTDDLLYPFTKISDGDPHS